MNWLYYNDTHRVLGQTCDTLILQDCEVITPNVLAHSVKTMTGGGSVTLLFYSVTTLRHSQALRMDAHVRYRTNHHDFYLYLMTESF